MAMAHSDQIFFSFFVNVRVTTCRFYRGTGTVRPKTPSDIIPWAQKIEFESCK